MKSSSFPVIFTPRLHLRQVKASDVNEIFAIRSNEMVNHYLDRPVATSIEDALEFIVKINNFIDSGESMYWAISLKDNPNLVGTICYWNFSPELNIAEIGYEMDPAFQGKGIMGEALRAIIAHGFQNMNLNRILAGVDPQNHNSIHLLQKNNFEFHENSGKTLLYKLDKV